MNSQAIQNLEAAGPTASTSQSDALLTMATQEGWLSQALGKAPMPKQAVRLTNWLLVPAHLDNTALPERTLDRIQAIFAAGIRPKGFVMVHEAPMQLSPGEQAEVVVAKYTELETGTIELDLDKLAHSAVAIASIAAKVATTAVMAVGSVLLPALFVAGTLLLDPILVAVTEDDVWIEIDRWWV